MKPTVTMLLDEYEQIQKQANETWQRLLKVERCLNVVYKMEISELFRIADTIEQNRALHAARETIMMGKI